MTGKEYQELAIRTCSIPYDQKEDRLFHAVFGLNVKQERLQESCRRNIRDMK